MDWYVVHTFSGYENTVKRGLEERIKGTTFAEQFGEILVPSEQVTERRGKTTVKTTRKFFPGYIFVQMELSKEAWHLVKNTPKVSGFLGGNTPRPVPQLEMDRMLGRALPSEEAADELPAVVYKVGEQVRVKSGAFANFTGEVEEVNVDKRKIWLSVSIFGRPTRVEVDFTEVEPAA
jgi:transcriptional antiterminator NusG